MWTSFKLAAFTSAYDNILDVVSAFLHRDELGVRSARDAALARASGSISFYYSGAVCQETHHPLPGERHLDPTQLLISHVVSLMETIAWLDSTEGKSLAACQLLPPLAALTLSLR